MSLGLPQTIDYDRFIRQHLARVFNKRDPSSQPPRQLQVLTMRPLPPSQNAYRIAVGRDRSPLGRSSLTLFQHGTHPQGASFRSAAVPK